MRTRGIQDFLALGLLLALVCWKFGPIFQGGLDRVVPTRALVAGQELGPEQEILRRADLTFYTWLAARNARELLESPFSIFEAEHCAPTPKSLALSAPGLTLGLFGIPAVLVSGDPILTYNWVVAVMILFAAFAIYLLIVEWTGSSAAGMTSALLYGLHAVRLDRVLWVAEVDLTWTVLGLLLARRLFVKGRWTDAVLLTCVCCLQMATSFYSFVASASIGVFFVAWLIFTYGLEGPRWKQLLLVASALSIFSVLLFGPYFELRSAGVLFDRGFRAPMPLTAYLPGEPQFFGFTLWALFFAGCLVGKRGLREGESGDPRWVLVAAGTLIALMAAGWSLDHQVRARWTDFPFTIPDFHLLFARILPGLENIRVISLLSAGAHLVVCIVAGIGTAALIRYSGKWRNSLALFIVALAFFEVMGPHWPGFTAAGRLQGLEIRPRDELIEFSQELGRVESSGAIFELPFDHAGGATVALGPERVFLSFYHRRRTSGCYSSYPSKDRAELAGLATPPLSRESLSALRDRGFQTLVVHRKKNSGSAYLADIRRLISGPGPPLKKVLESESLVAFDIQFPAKK